MKKPHRRATAIPGQRPGLKQPWALAPFRSRGQFSPRLLMAWVLVAFMLWLIRRWITTQPVVLNGLLVQPREIAEVVAILAALIGGLLSLGTLQKIRLTTPTPDQADDLNEEPIEDAPAKHCSPQASEGDNPPPAAD